MLNSTGRTVKGEKNWVIVGRNSAKEDEPPKTPRAVYLFKPRIKHVDIRKIRKNRVFSQNSSFQDYSDFKDIDFFRKFPRRKFPLSVMSKRNSYDPISILGTQMIYFQSKKNKRLI